MLKNLNLKKRILITIFLTSSMIFSNPKTPITVSTTIDIEVVKPIEVISKSYIQHNIFKGTAKNIDGDIFLELKASPNQMLNISYPSSVSLNSKTDTVIIILKGIKGGGSAEVRGNITNLIDSPKYGANKIYYIPYSITLLAETKGGLYEGIIPITISYN